MKKDDAVYGNLVIRADASSEMGAGHVMRTLALAQAWQDLGGEITFVTAQSPQALKIRLKSEALAVELLSAPPGSLDDAVETIKLASHSGAKWVVVDGYNFGSEYQRVIKDSGLCLLFIDDMARVKHYWADIVLNQNIRAHEGLYANRELYTRLLLGTHYLLLRREFLSWRRWKRRIPEVACKVLVTLGGSDPDNVTLKVINALKKIGISDLDVKIVVGPSNPNTQVLQNALLFAPCSLRLLHNVTSMPELMAWADMAISAGGSTCWELVYMGLPNLILILAENQVSVAGGLHTEGAALNFGWYRDLSHADICHAIEQIMFSSEMRHRMSRRGRELVDGEGTGRVLRHMDNRTLCLRRVCKDDCRLIWEWANEIDVRSASFSPEPIPWENHVQWFKSKIIDPNCIFYIVSNRKSTPIGQVRYDLQGNEAVLSISIDKKFRGQGYGNLAILLSSKELFRISEVEKIHAYAKRENEYSARAFLKAGFRDMCTKIIHGHRATDFVLTKDEA